MADDDFNAALIGACGFYCGSCPTYIRGECPGCRNSAGNECFTFRCVSRKKLRFCGECGQFPCKPLLSREKVTVLDKKWLRWKLHEKGKHH